MRQLVLTVFCFVLPCSLPAQGLGPRDIDSLPASAPAATLKYGSKPLQYGELRLPTGRGPFPVAVVIHGGCWTKGYATLRNTAPIASTLATHGVATWNIEYRQTGDPGGGWPGTFRDWGAAVDYLREIQKKYPLDLSRVAVVGHSAGAHAALWVASRQKLSKSGEIGAADPLPIQMAFAIDGPADLSGFVGPDEHICGKSVVAALMGGTPSEKPERYRLASPQLLLSSVPQLLVAASVLTPHKAKEYAELANGKGGRVEVLALDTGHFEVIAPGRNEWNAIEERLVMFASKVAR